MASPGVHQRRQARKPVDPAVTHPLPEFLTFARSRPGEWSIVWEGRAWRECAQLADEWNRRAAFVDYEFKMLHRKRGSYHAYRVMVKYVGVATEGGG